jgi:hypothetical protein
VFCVPEQAVRESPRHERVLMFLAVALMESLGIHTQFTSDSADEPVEGSSSPPIRKPSSPIGSATTGCGTST